MQGQARSIRSRKGKRLDVQETRDAMPSRALLYFLALVKLDVLICCRLSCRACCVGVFAWGMFSVSARFHSHASRVQFL